MMHHKKTCLECESSWHSRCKEFLSDQATSMCYIRARPRLVKKQKTVALETVPRSTMLLSNGNAPAVPQHDSAGHGQLWNLWSTLGLAIFILATACFQPAAAQCSTPVTTVCPTALAAAQALTGNNPNLPISNAQYKGPPCSTAADRQVGLMIITSFGSPTPCHYLSSIMSTGKRVSSASASQIQYQAQIASHDKGIAAEPSVSGTAHSNP